MNTNNNKEVILGSGGKFHYLPFDSSDMPDEYRQLALGWFGEERWENEMQAKKWLEDYGFFIKSVPANHRKILVQKGFEYARLLLKFHKENETTRNPLVHSWERRITIAENLLNTIEFELEEIKQVKPSGEDIYKTFEKVYFQEVTPMRIKDLQEKLEYILHPKDRLKFLEDEKAKYLHALHPRVIASSGVCSMNLFPKDTPIFFDRNIQIEIDKIKNFDDRLTKKGAGDTSGNFECTLTDDQIRKIVELINEIKIFKNLIVSTDLKSLFDCTNTIPFSIANGHNLSIAALFNLLSIHGFITELWQSVAERNRCFNAVRKPTTLTAHDLANAVRNVNMNDKTYKKINNTVSTL